MELFLKRQRIEAYFRGRRRRMWWICGAIIGLVLLFGAAPVGSALHLSRGFSQYQPVTVLTAIGLIVVAASCLAWFIESKYIPSDGQIDEWAAIDWAAVLRRSMREFNLDADELIHEPIEFRYFIVDGIAPSKRGRDFLWRSAALGATVIHSTRHQLMIYMCKINFLSGHFAHQENCEIRYGDVVTIAVSSPERVVDMKSADKYDRQLARQFPKSVVRGQLHLNDIVRVELRLVNDTVIPLASYRGGGAASTEDKIDEVVSDHDAIDRLRKLIRDVRAQMADPVGRAGPDRA